MLTQHFLPNHSGTSHIDTWTLRVIDYPQSEVNAVSLEPVSLSETNIKIGRHEDCDLFLPDHDSYISRQHCHLKLDGESVILWVDGGNGVYIDDNELKIAQGEYCTLYGGEVIGIGEYKIELCRVANTVSPLPPEDILNNGEDNSSSFEEIFGITGENFVENKKPEGGGRKCYF